MASKEVIPGVEPFDTFGEEVFIGLGGNLGDPLAHLKAGLEGLAKMEGYQPLAVSSPYLTAPVGPQDQPAFINAVARGNFKGEARTLLRNLLALEKGQGRQRKEHWGPRTLDLDILLFGRRVIRETGLMVPHPEIPHRAFVLVPLMELAPDLILPVWQKTVVRLWHEMEPDQKAQQKIEKKSWG